MQVPIDKRNLKVTFINKIFYCSRDVRTDEGTVSDNMLVCLNIKLQARFGFSKVCLDLTKLHHFGKILKVFGNC